jgi:hypothetical protein
MRKDYFVRPISRGSMGTAKGIATDAFSDWTKLFHWIGRKRRSGKESEAAILA